jgi:hypothetical protein
MQSDWAKRVFLEECFMVTKTFNSNPGWCLILLLIWLRRSGFVPFRFTSLHLHCLRRLLPYCSLPWLRALLSSPPATVSDGKKAATVAYLLQQFEALKHSYGNNSYVGTIELPNLPAEILDKYFPGAESPEITLSDATMRVSLCECGLGLFDYGRLTVGLAAALDEAANHNGSQARPLQRPPEMLYSTDCDNVYLHGKVLSVRSLVVEA